MKTAVEWLANELCYITHNSYILDNTDDVTDIVNKAKEMEIDQIVQTYANGQSDILKALRKRTIKDRILQTLAGITIGYLIFGL